MKPALQANPTLLEIPGAGQKAARFIGGALWAFAAVSGAMGYMNPSARVFQALAAGVLALAGSVLACWRSGLALDKGAGAARKWWGFGVPFTGSLFFSREDTRPLADFSKVHIARETRTNRDSHGTSSSHTVYPVTLRGRGTPLTVGQPQDYHQARRLAEGVAAFLGLDLSDASTGQTVERKAGTLDQSLRDRVRRGGEGVDLPFPPHGMKTRLSQEGPDLVLEIPAIGFGAPHMAGLGITGMAGVAAFAFKEYVLAAFAVIMALAVAGNARGRFRVLASAQGLRVIRHGGLFKKTTVFPAQELEELFIQETPAGKADLKDIPEKYKGLAASALAVFFPKAIVARSDKASARIIAPVEDEELRYLHALLTSRLAR